MERGFFIAGSVAALVAVALGAFGAHALRGTFQTHPELESTYQTAVRYHMFHSLALLVTAWAVVRFGGTAAAAGYAFIAGMILFSGSLYLLALTGARRWGAVTPFGGAAFLLGWALLAWSALRA